MRPDVGKDKLFLGQRHEGVQCKTIQRAVQRFANALIDRCQVSLEKVAKLLGHSNLNTIRIYTTPGDDDLEDAMGMI